MMSKFSIEKNALDLCISIFVFFQVLEGLKKVTVISPEDVSFAESRRDALIAIAKYVSHLCFCLILNLSVEAFSCSFCFLLGAGSMSLEISYTVHTNTHIFRVSASPFLNLFLIQRIITHLTMERSSDGAVSFLSVN